MRRERNPLPNARRRNALLGLVLSAAALTLILAGCGGAQPGPPATGPLTPPTFITVAGEDGKLTVSWDKQPRTTGYTLSWSTDPKLTAATRVDDLQGTPYVISGLTNDKEVYFQLIANNLSGSSKPAEFRAKPLKVPFLRFQQHIAVIVQPSDTYATLAARFLGDRNKGWMIADYNDLEQLTPYQAVTVPLQTWKIGGLKAGEFQTVPVLTYHKFTTDTKTDKMTVTGANFEAQMKFLQDNDYRVITLDQLADFLDFKAQIPDRAVVITIDDGWKSLYDIAYPILKKYGYPATLFLITDFPDDPTAKGQALSWLQVKEMAKGGLDVECHTKTHRNLKMQSDEDFKAYLKSLEVELKSVQSEIKRKAGLTCRYLAYPYGARNPLVVALTQKYGFRLAFTVQRGSNSFFTQDFLVKRSMIYGEYGPKEFEKNLNVSAEMK